VTYLAPYLAEKGGDDAPATIADALASMGQVADGTLRSRGVFSEKGLIKAPESIDWLPASTLTCTWLTAWNILFGLKGQEAKPGSWILVQGTGGVSIATLQVAAAAGVNVVATSSSEEKSARLKALGAVATVDYRANPDTWGRLARDLTPDGRGFDIIADIGGNQTLPQSLAAIRPDGLIAVVGGVGDASADAVPMFAALVSTCVVRGILAGTRNQFKEVVRFVDEKGVKPAIDDVVFELAEAKDAYRRLKEKKHFSKVVIRVDH
jgi:NADPH:quinone reductase-like Zn-dependent oxidoreductase